MTPLIAVTVPGGSEWLIILVIAVLLFGAKKLPELGSSVGRSIKNFKRGIEDADLDDEESSAAPGEEARQTREEGQ